MVEAELERLLAEQREAAGELAINPEDWGARLGLADLVAEEILILTEC